MRRLIAHDRVDAIAIAFAVLPDHQTLQIVLSPLNSADQERCLASLESYLRDTKRIVGNDFLYEP